MKMQQLEYIIAIAHAGSITAAAKNLYQAQPNISIALKDLESEIGMQIFWRTPNGMVLTPEGESFLMRAKDIVESMHSLEADYTNRVEEGVSLKISSVRSAYMSMGVGAWINKLSPDERMEIHLTETNTNKVIDDVSSGKTDVGIIRMPSTQKEVYIDQLNNRKLASRELMEYPTLPVLAVDHPLADKEFVTLEELRQYPSIVHADDEMSVFNRSYINSGYEERDTDKLIYVHDNGSKMVLLNSVKNVYMWATPGPSAMSMGRKFVVKKCPEANLRSTDMIICKKTNENNRVIKSITEHLIDYTENMLSGYINDYDLSTAYADIDKNE